jgi:tRNA threonylcarbamoyladenosine biosynthesis protein TsaB
MRRALFVFTMFTLRALLERHRSILLIDSASARIQVALFHSGAATIWESAQEEAGTAVFSLTEKVFARAGTPSAPLGVSDVGAFVFCHGPGSVLGIRTTAVAVRTWCALKPRPCYAYTSLAVTAHLLASAENLRNFSVIADARRETWHRIRVETDGALSSLERTPASALDGTLILPENFRHWSALPTGVRSVPYDLVSQFSLLSETPLFTDAPEPDAFLHEEPSYQTWTPKIHRAPA